MNSKILKSLSREERHTLRIKQGWIKNAVSSVINDKLKRLHQKKKAKRKIQKRDELKIQKMSRNEEDEQSIVIVLDKEPSSTSQSLVESSFQATQDLLSQQSSQIAILETSIGGNQMIEILEDQDSSQDTSVLHSPQFSPEQGICEICCRKNEEPIEQAACGHSACTSCWNEWLFRSYQEEKAPICFYCRRFLDQSELTVISKPKTQSS